MIPLTTQQKLNALAQQYASRLFNDVRNVLGSPQYKNTGQLEQSLQVQVTPCTPTDAPKIVLTYADQGFFIGYKNPQWTSLPNVDKMTKWAETAPIDLNDVPGYAYGSAPNLSPEKSKARIAFAIAKEKRKNDTWKPKRWKKAANLGELLKDLNNDTLQAYIKEVETILADAITNGTVLS